MKKYGVTVPFAGAIYVSVEAESEEDALTKALKVANLDYNNGCDIVEVNFYKRLMEGNCSNVTFDSYEVEELGDY